MKTIRELRHQRGWSQSQLALRIEVHPQAVYLWESGRRMPQVQQVRKLGQLFGLCSDEITLLDPALRSRSRQGTTARSEDKSVVDDTQPA